MPVTWHEERRKKWFWREHVWAWAWRVCCVVLFFSKIKIHDTWYLEVKFYVIFLNFFHVFIFVFIFWFANLIHPYYFRVKFLYIYIYIYKRELRSLVLRIRVSVIYFPPPKFWQRRHSHCLRGLCGMLVTWHGERRRKWFWREHVQAWAWRVCCVVLFFSK